MNFTGMIACLLVGADCLSKAMGSPQTVFSESSIWLWYIVAGLWFVSAFTFAMQMFGVIEDR